MTITKTITKFCPLQNQTNYISSKGFDKSYPKMYFLLNLSHCFEVMCIYVKFQCDDDM